MTRTAATLEVDLLALVSNYRLLKNKLDGRDCAAVVKADAYGLGMENVAPALAKAGCDIFFVATLEEAISLRKILPKPLIHVFNGVHKGEEKEFLSHRLIPVINSPEQLTRWEAFSSSNPAIDCCLHIDTGMTRLGFTNGEAIKLASDPKRVARAQIRMIMTHLACADDKKNPKNEEQRKRFEETYRLFGSGIAASMANSSGIFLSSGYHYDLARPGCALYGINPTAGKNPMQHVATLSAPILQLRILERNETVGYDASYKAKKGARIAIVGLGYADGYFRLLSNKGVAYLAGHKAPVVGMVSMDMVALDVTKIPESAITPSTRAEFINQKQPVDDIAAACGTIGYEIFTRIGDRVKRVYRS